ncbi:MAG: exodeoxyribonuclease VII small subunit [Propionibacteriaceae bacterium]|jgi:exodeoxyribonuclease VII small subunit|nr:exodeoxyribonuclease VII small subunit [Propionibacteriaceae bacterium]
MSETQKKSKNGDESSEQANETQLTYEQARDELITVVNRLESGGESLAESMELFKRGEYLSTLCERYLSEARAVLKAANQD